MKLNLLNISILALVASCSKFKTSVQSENPNNVEQQIESSLGPSIDLGFARKISNIQYHSQAVSDPRFNKLDVYFQSLSERRPVIVYVHGSGWAGPKVVDGDKENLLKNERLPKSLIENGFVIASMNRRALNLQLNGQNKESEKTTYEDQVADVAQALRWINLNAEKFGGDSNRIVLFGFSSGAHLVSLAINNTKYLSKEAVNLDSIKAVVSVDFHAYNIPLAINQMAGTSLEKEIQALKTIFGSTSEEQRKASPSEYVNDSAGPPILLISAGIKDGLPQNVSNLGSGAFKDKLLSFNRKCQHHHFESKGHTQLITDYGTEKDDGFSLALISFLEEAIFPRTTDTATPNLRAIINKIVSPHIASSRQDITRSPGYVVGIVSPKYSDVLGFGTKRIGENLPPDGNTFFGIGSVSKIFTGIMLAKQVVSKQMDPKLDLSTYLKEPLKSALSPKLNLEEAVSHHSGLQSFPENINSFRDEDGDGAADSVDWSPATNYERKHLLQCLIGGGCQPKTDRIGIYSYSNLGIGLVSLALEDHLGVSSFDELLKTNFSLPLGMDDTGTNTSSFIETTGLRKAQGYRSDKTFFEPLPFSDMGFMAGSGEIISTANNLNRLLEILVNLRSSHLQSAIDLAMEPIHSKDDNEAIGYAIDINQNSMGTRLYSKEGATRSSRAYLVWRRDLQIGVVILANSGSGRVKDIGDSVISAVANEN